MDILKKKKEDRAEKKEQYHALVKAAESGELTKEQKTQEETLFAEIEAMDKDIAQLERLEKGKKSAAKETMNALPGPTQDNASEEKELREIAAGMLISKAFKLVATEKQLDGREKEAQEIARAEAEHAGIELTGNFHIPHKFIKIGRGEDKTNEFLASRKAALSVGTEGTDVVFTEYGGYVIPYLNPVPVASKLGVTFLQGLRGNVQWPRVNGDLAFAFETETSDVDETTPTFDNVSISPKRFGGYTDVTMQMLNQSVFVVEPWLRNRLTNRYEITVDQQIFNGSGASNQTTGLFNTSGVNTLSTGSGSANDMTYKALLSMKRDCKVANSRTGREGWVTNAYGEFALYNTPMQASGVEGNFILNANTPANTLVGNPFYVSEIIPSNFSEGGQTDLCGIAFSKYWQGLIAGFWGGMDLLVDPYTQRLGGKIRFVVNAFMDVDVEQPLEFSICKDWDASDLPALT